MKQFLGLLICFSILSCNHPESKDFERNQNALSALSKNNLSVVADSDNEYKVVGIKDGDTFVVLVNGKEQVVRFAHIDCPEKKQPYGGKAKQSVSELCFGKFVRLIHNNKFDRHKRLIAEVILQDGTNLNKSLMKNGLAWHFKKYSKDKSYSDLENEAKQLKVGLWADENAIAPWTWRK